MPATDRTPPTGYGDTDLVLSTAFLYLRPPAFLSFQLDSLNSEVGPKTARCNVLET